jgi:catechol 2,3-dioxygenase-like lactoylglutathione lyase family enzyme
MKRLHLHVAVDDLDTSIRFYSTLFAAQPSVTRADYAKWMLDDPRVNFAISRRGQAAGIEHLGIQVDDPAELAEVYGRLKAADAPVLEEGHTSCCYARSEKSWITDPTGIAWEVFHTYGDSTAYGGAVRESAQTPRLASTLAAIVPASATVADLPVSTPAAVAPKGSCGCGPSVAALFDADDTMDSGSTSVVPAIPPAVTPPTPAGGCGTGACGR